MCQALKYIHLKKILHRDIKTQNVFLDAEGRIKLGDFGISKVLENTMDYAKTSLGTPFFLSPEICNGEKYNYKTDIWMLGCVIFELCTLKKPFTGENLIILMTNIIKEDISPIPSNYSDNLKNIVKLLMMKNPEQRPFIRDILEIDFVREKMKELGIEDLESPVLSAKHKDYNSNKSFGISLCSNSPEQKVRNLQDNLNDLSLDSNNKKRSNTKLEQSISNQNLIDNNNQTMLGNTNSKGMVNCNSISMLNMNKPNNSNNSISNSNTAQKMRRKVRVPDKINKKYDSMGQQAFGKVIDDIGLGDTMSK